MCSLCSYFWMVIPLNFPAQGAHHNSVIILLRWESSLILLFEFWGVSFLFYFKDCLSSNVSTWATLCQKKIYILQKDYIFLYHVSWKFNEALGREGEGGWIWWSWNCIKPRVWSFFLVVLSSFSTHIKIPGAIQSWLSFSMDILVTENLA